MEGLPEWFIQNLTAEELVEARREKLQHLELWKKLNAGQLYQVTSADVDELFAIFDVEGSGEISIEELMEINKVEGLVLTTDDVKALGKDADKDGSGLISAKELYKAIIQGEVAYNLVKKSINEESFAQQLSSGECLIDDLIEWMRHEYETDSDLWSLPQTICLFAIFQYCASSKIPVRSNWRMAKNFDAAEFGSYKLSFIYDYTSLWDFVGNTFLEQHAYQDAEQLREDPQMYKIGRYFRRNQMLGASRLRRIYTDPMRCSLPEELQRVYYPLVGVNCFKMGEQMIDDRFILYHERYSVLKQRVKQWSEEYWLDDNTTSLSIDTVYLNPALGTWTFEQLTWFFENNGYLRNIQTTETFLIDPYKEWSNAIPDVIFILILSRILYFEMKELLPAMATGLDGIMNYLQLWNVVDWLTIIWGVVCVGLWFIAVLQLGSLEAVIQELPLPVYDSIVKANRTYLSPGEVNIPLPREDYLNRLGKMFDTFQAVSIWNESVRLVAIFYLFVLMLKFFKSFKANKRLNVVINTLTHSLKDVSHFAIVFLTIFLCYAWAAHVFFGGNIEAASSMFGAIYWRWSGAVDSTDMEDLSPMGRVLGFAYTLSYEFLVLNLLFGILFGLIFEAYGRTRAEAGKTDTLLTQIRKSIAEMRRKKDFVNDYFMICALEDEDAPAHPGEIVTVRSLCEAFATSKMTKENAEYIITKVRDFKLSKSHEVEVGLVDALKLVARMRTISLKSIIGTEALLKQLKDESQKPQEMRYRCIMAGFDPDTPGEMQEFIRVSTQQALEDEHPLPNVVPQAGPQDSKHSLGSRNREHSTKEGTKDIVEDNSKEEQIIKEKHMLSKAESLELAVYNMQELHSKSVDAIREELDVYRAQSADFEGELWTVERAVRSNCKKGQEGAAQLEERFQDANLHIVQDLPDRLLKLSEMAKASRQIVESGKAGFSSDPLKRLENRIGVLFSRCRTFLDQAEAQHDLSMLLNRMISIVAVMSRESESAKSSA